MGREATDAGEIRHRSAVDAAGYAVIYHCMTKDPLLSDGAFRTYTLLLSYAWQSNRCWPGQQRLAEERSCNLRTIRRHLDELQQRELLTIERRGDKQTNVYILENIQAAYQKREDKNVPSSDRTFLSGPWRGHFCPVVIGQKCPPKKNQNQKETDRKLNSSKRICDAQPPPVSPVSAAAVLVEDLISNDLNRVDALRLAKENPDECRRQLDILPFVAEFKSTKGAYLRSAIEGGYGPPKGYEQAQQKRTEAAKREKATKASEVERCEQAAQRQAIETARAHLMQDEVLWAKIQAQAEAQLPPPLRGKPGHVAYQPALEAHLSRIVAALAEDTSCPRPTT